MSQLVIEPHYLGSLEFFSLIIHSSGVCFEVQDSYAKQTYRNRAYILSSNKVQTLTVPVSYSNRTKMKDVRVDYSQRWIKDHWGALYSSYGKAPFYEFFCQEFKSVWDKKITMLVDLNLDFLRVAMKILQKEIDMAVTDRFERHYDSDFRNVISPKKPFSNRKIYRPVPYSQLFGDTFVPNLSIVDLIMCEGPNAAQILSNSNLRM